MKPQSVTVRHRTSVVTVYPVTVKGATYWRFRKGRRFVTRSTIDKAKDEARRYAESTFLTGGRIGLLGEAQTRAIQRMLDVDPTLALVDEFLLWHARKCPRVTVRQARAEFLAAKGAAAGASAYNVTRLRQRLALLPDDAIIAEIGPADLPAVEGAPRTRRNHIAAWTTFFRWCRKRGWLPSGEDTAPELLERPAITRVAPSTWTRPEFDVLLANADNRLRVWLCLGAWAGLRTEEVAPDVASKKDGVRWEDFKWSAGTIEIRAEVAKTGVRRLAPILPCLEAVLRPLAGTGRVFEGLPPHRTAHGGRVAETTRLGQLVGGWKRNALRHSYISFRSAIAGTMRAAAEAGNSESVTRRNYQDAKSEAEAAEWFAVPKGYAKVTQRSRSQRVTKPRKP